MTDARSAILSRLRAAPRLPPPERPAWTPFRADGDRVARFRQAAEAWRAEVHETTDKDWPGVLRSLLAAKGVGSLLVGSVPDVAVRLDEAFAAGGGPTLIPYDRPAEAMKEILLHQVTAGLTTTRGAIAETGSLVLWPTPAEPRLLSLLPPIHIALLRAESIRDSLAETLAAEDWAAGLPTNALLISGPSKTADIEQTLAFGVHGPKELVIMVLR